MTVLHLSTKNVHFVTSIYKKCSPLEIVSQSACLKLWSISTKQSQPI